jgi:hypothetical protein
LASVTSYRLLVTWTNHFRNLLLFLVSLILGLVFHQTNYLLILKLRKIRQINLWCPTYCFYLLILFLYVFLGFFSARIKLELRHINLSIKYHFNCRAKKKGLVDQRISKGHLSCKILYKYSMLLHSYMLLHSSVQLLCISMPVCSMSLKQKLLHGIISITFRFA